ncbi:CPBP family intramembrane glutamic endopeptidase [Entomospira culicis]|uniref:CPBP family intramembrane metalloprotease n=2 Tax=Entomospira culicis TaxID=2719989 RepID=A0A968KZA6_9SPIO|nr:CPBP family intramembrane glutamic endopeptidase [Entomospira culicis]NIZ18911.1 CPBP family intramembrane metalloprotease [Entomospira culicis]NIZ69126.1 CPBP family intramembrane metalloprotease [Entomospira culicis]WDI39340.1 CPBP family intramembrane metalloprotease [Entomospira culicis]
MKNLIKRALDKTTPIIDNKKMQSIDYHTTKLGTLRFILAIIFVGLFSFLSIYSWYTGAMEDISLYLHHDGFVLVYLIISIIQFIVFLGIAIALQPKMVYAFTDFRLQWKGVFLLLGASLLLTLLSGFVIPPELAENPAGILFQRMRHLYPALFVFMMILVGYSEELLFRLLPISFSKKHPLLIGVIWQIIFASMHLYQGILAFFFTFILGMIFWFGFRRGMSLHSVAWTHIIYNLTVTFFY